MAVYWFEDTRNGHVFGIFNPDVAKAFDYDHKNANGPFRPCDAPESLQVENNPEDEKTPENESEAAETTNQSIYEGMTIDELKEELTAREIEYKAKDTKPTLIGLLLKDDANGGE